MVKHPKVFSFPKEIYPLNSRLQKSLKWPLSLPSSNTTLRPSLSTMTIKLFNIISMMTNILVYSTKDSNLRYLSLDVTL